MVRKEYNRRKRKLMTEKKRGKQEMPGSLGTENVGNHLIYHWLAELDHLLRFARQRPSLYKPLPWLGLPFSSFARSRALLFPPPPLPERPRDPPACLPLAGGAPAPSPSPAAPASTVSRFVDLSLEPLTLLYRGNNRLTSCGAPPLVKRGFGLRAILAGGAGYRGPGPDAMR